MSENQTYTDQTYTDANDDSYLEVRPNDRSTLRLVAYESGCYGATVDLSRHDVERLVEQAQAWLEETKTPTAPGSVISLTFGDGAPDLILTRLANAGIANLRFLAAGSEQWVSQYGSLWSDEDIARHGSFAVIHDAGAEQ